MPSTDTRAALEKAACTIQAEADAAMRAGRAWVPGTDWLGEVMSAALARSAPEEQADTPDDHAQFAEVRSLGLAAGREMLEARRKQKVPAPEERGEGEPRCEKCDSRDIYTRYRRKGEYIDHGGYPDYERAREDCLRRYCRTCGDKWIDPLASPPVPVEGKAFVSASCRGETCALCDAPAAMKIGEEIMHDDPMPNRHNLTQYVCAKHGAAILQPYRFRDDPTCQFCGAAPVEGEPREVGIVREVGMAWECTRCGALLGAGLEVCEAAYDEDVGYTPHPPVHRPDGVDVSIEGERELTERILAAMRAERARQLDFGCEPGDEDFAHAIARAIASHPVQGAGGGEREEVERCRKQGCGALKGRCTDWDCPEGDFVRSLEGRASPAPSAPEEEP